MDKESKTGGQVAIHPDEQWVAIADGPRQSKWLQRSTERWSHFSYRGSGRSVELQGLASGRPRGLEMKDLRGQVAIHPDEQWVAIADGGNHVVRRMEMHSLAVSTVAGTTLDSSTSSWVRQLEPLLLLLLYYSRRDTKSLRALNTSPPWNCFALLRSSGSRNRVLYRSVQLSGTTSSGGWRWIPSRSRLSQVSTPPGLGILPHVG